MSEELLAEVRTLRHESACGRCFALIGHCNEFSNGFPLGCEHYGYRKQKDKEVKNEEVQDGDYWLRQAALSEVWKHLFAGKP